MFFIFCGLKPLPIGTCLSENVVTRIASSTLAVVWAPRGQALSLPCPHPALSAHLLLWLQPRRPLVSSFGGCYSIVSFWTITGPPELLHTTYVIAFFCVNSNARPYIEPGSAVVLTGRWFWCSPRERLVMSGDSFGCSSWQGGSGGAAGIQWVEAQDACQHPEVQCTAPTTKSHPQRAVVWRSPALVYGAQVWAQETDLLEGLWALVTLCSCWTPRGRPLC